ncbi:MULTISPECIES: DUF4296 domain-containing protein [Ignavibacterium]|uniref:DUF4296 domain-containing protein n=1 Tax=Ignavibacterium TaxID=795750 RepID=UPI0025BC50E6|nr:MULTISPECIES: DUF4296 domain-containing protein [Ignavibacterium]MBI5661937.1 DUF4296 domain-containing protein [Ignavibacterium album]
MKNIFHIFFFIIILFISCKEKPPINEEQFVKIYADLISAPDSISVDTLKFSDYKKKVFSDFGCSENEFEQTVKFYNQTPEKWDEFFKKVIKYVETTDDSLKNAL